MSGTCWRAIGELLFLWPPGFGAVHSLHVWSPVSGTVRVLAQSTIVTLLSLPWLGLLLVFVRFLCLRLTLWASACVGPHGYRPSPGSVLLLLPGFLFSGLVVWGSFHPVPSHLSSFGMWSPFRVIGVLCHYCSTTKVTFGEVFLLGGSLPFRRGVVVSLRPLSLSLSWLHVAVATAFPFSTGVTFLRDRVTPAGSWTACPRSERRFSLSFWVRYAGQFLAEHPVSVCGCLRALSLRVCCLVVLTVSLPLG